MTTKLNPQDFRKGARVRVKNMELEDNPAKIHPHAGEIGEITELMGVVLTGPGWNPRAVIKRDSDGRFMVVGLQYLERA